MELTGLILFCGAMALFLIWGYHAYYKVKYKRFLKNPEADIMFEYSKGIALFIVIAISAGMTWG